MEFIHKSVLLNECISGLDIKSDGVYVDGTTGGAGHSTEIAKRLTKGRLICFDKDEEALEVARHRLSGFECKIDFIHKDFKELKVALSELGIKAIDGMLMDLGVSSYQLDEKARGFSYMSEDASLDMRMDQSDARTAKDIVNTYSEEELIRIFKEYGEEKFAKRIAQRITVSRKSKKIETTGDLNEIIRSAVPANTPGGHPSKRVFQALRIEVNEELNGLYEFIYELPNLLNDGGRICVISFHSLEDRAVKNAFKKAMDPCICPKNFPVCTCGRKPLGVQITKKPILPSPEEMEENLRSKSAKLRIFERRLLKE